MKFLVTEIQKYAEDQFSTPTYAYDDREHAEAKYYSILAAAAVSSVPTHAAMLFTEDGVPMMNAVYHHIPEPEPEPNPEPEQNTEPEGE